MAYRSESVSGHGLTFRRFGRIATVEFVWSREDLVAGTNKRLANVVPDWAQAMTSVIHCVIFDGAEMSGYFTMGATDILIKPTKNATYIEGNIAYICKP